MTPILIIFSKENMFSQIKLLGNAIVTVDLSESSVCKRCRRAIWWAVTKNAKKMPICKDNDGNFISHFTDCPGATEFRKDARLDEAQRQGGRELWKQE